MSWSLRFDEPIVLEDGAEHRGPVEFARIATLQVLNRHRVREFTDRKDTHWGKRKLKRDE